MTSFFEKGGKYEMEDEALELLYALQVQQVAINEKLMEKWAEVGDLISEILEIHQKMLVILQDESKEKEE
jgi:hypothetical protein